MRNWHALNVKTGTVFRNDCQTHITGSSDVTAEHTSWWSDIQVAAAQLKVIHIRRWNYKIGAQHTWWWHQSSGPVSYRGAPSVFSPWQMINSWSEDLITFVHSKLYSRTHTGHHPYWVIWLWAETLGLTTMSPPNHLATNEFKASWSPTHADFPLSMAPLGSPMVNRKTEQFIAKSWAAQS